MVMAGLYSLLLMPSSANAQCAPPAGPGTPPPGTTVTCNGSANNENGTNGYGDGSQTGITINVKPSAIVTGSFGGPVGPPFTTANGIAVGNGNTINLLAGTTLNPTQVTGSSANGANGILAGDGNSISIGANSVVTGTSNGISVGNNTTPVAFAPCSDLENR